MDKSGNKTDHPPTHFRDTARSGQIFQKKNNFLEEVILRTNMCIKHGIFERFGNFQITKKVSKKIFDAKI